MITLPSYTDASNRVLESESSHLDWFISENEPVEMVGKAKFRRELEAVLAEVEQEVRNECNVGFGKDLEEEFVRLKHVMIDKEFELEIREATIGAHRTTLFFFGVLVGSLISSVAYLLGG